MLPSPADSAAGQQFVRTIRFDGLLPDGRSSRPSSASLLPVKRVGGDGGDRRRLPLMRKVANQALGRRECRPYRHLVYPIRIRSSCTFAGLLYGALAAITQRDVAGPNRPAARRYASGGLPVIVHRHHRHRQLVYCSE